MYQLQGIPLFHVISSSLAVALIAVVARRQSLATVTCTDMTQQDVFDLGETETAMCKQWINTDLMPKRVFTTADVWD